MSLFLLIQYFLLLYLVSNFVNQGSALDALRYAFSKNEPLESTFLRINVLTQYDNEYDPVL